MTVRSGPHGEGFIPRQPLIMILAFGPKGETGEAIAAAAPSLIRPRRRTGVGRRASTGATTHRHG